MKVIYKHTPNDGTIPRLTKGNEYIVVGLDHECYRVLNDANEPILYPKECFSISESGIPNDWIRRKYPDGEYHIDPPECAQPGFYEDYFDGNEQARNTFNTAIQSISN